MVRTSACHAEGRGFEPRRSRHFSSPTRLCRRTSQFAGLEPVAVDEREPAASNCLRVADRLILPAGNPRTAEGLRERGFDLVEADVSELQKAEAGVTCMSLIDERP